MRAKVKTQRNNYHEGQHGPSFAGKTSVSLIAYTHAQKSLSERSREITTHIHYVISVLNCMLLQEKVIGNVQGTVQSLQESL